MRLHRDAYSAMIGIVVLAVLIALFLAIVNPIR